MELHELLRAQDAEIDAAQADASEVEYTKGLGRQVALIEAFWPARSFKAVSCCPPDGEMTRYTADKAAQRLISGGYGKRSKETRDTPGRPANVYTLSEAGYVYATGLLLRAVQARSLALPGCIWPAERKDGTTYDYSHAYASREVYQETRGVTPLPQEYFSFPLQASAKEYRVAGLL